MREFQLTNANGESFDLMRKDAFLHDPDGLGFERDIDYTRVGCTWVLTRTDYDRPEPTGEMVFRGYEQYDAFCDFVNVGGVELGYKPLDTWYWLPCEISLGKSEIEHDTMRLRCEITFHGSAPWAEHTSYMQAGLEAYGTGYPLHYSYSYGKGSPGLVTVANGLKESPFKLHLFGAATNPAWSLRKNGVVIGTGKVKITLAEGHKLVIDSDPAHMEIAEYTTDNVYVANRYAQSDFSTERILLLPTGTSSIYASDDNGTIDCVVEVDKLV